MYSLFQSLTNWGREEVVTDLIADDNSIQMVAFYTYVGKDRLQKILLNTYIIVHTYVFYCILSCNTTHCVLSGHDKVNNSIGWKVNYGPESVQGTTSFNVDNADGTDYPTVSKV